MNYYPFSAIVGQPQLKTALLLCAVDTSLGGVLIRGDKGSAKSTAARALTAVLPAIDRISACAFNCAPASPCGICAVCNHPDAPAAQAAAVPFVTLPLGATEDRVLGTLDLERALQGGQLQRAFQPGLLAAAHRGILYIDEVNLLADHLVDVLLDVAAMGVNSVQREGLSLSHPARFTLIGTMNLEEGDLRPQLLDRFGLMVEVVAPREKAQRAEVVRRRIAFEADPSAFAALWDGPQAALRRQLHTAQQLLPQVALSDALLELISHLCCEFEVASLRADIVMHKAARALAALDGRMAATPDDVRNAAALVLPHRRRRKPFEQPGLDHDKLDRLMQDASPPAEPEPSGAQDESGRDTPGEGGEPAGSDNSENSGGEENAQQQVFAAAAAAVAPQISIDNLRAADAGMAGRRSNAADAERGRVLRALPNVDANPGSLALGATLRSAALRHVAQHGAQSAEPLTVVKADLQRQVKLGQRASLILFVVDASASMAAQRRMEAVKGAVLSLLTDAYQRRDEVAVIGFGGAEATLLLAPTRSVDRAEQDLRELPTGGRTPLPHALQLALTTLSQAGAHCAPLLILLSDGKANVALSEGGDAWRESLALAEQLAATGVAALVLDTESGYLRLGRAAQLAQAMGAECLGLEQLGADNLALTVRGRI
ncbi:MAG: magnesium chelatase [Herbaspirillum sp.]|nr:magnesium chelatase [Herbaspirillum sp.]